MPKGLPAKKLRATLDPERIPYADSSEIPARKSLTGFQPRAIQALTMALRLRTNEYNVFVSGEANMGRTYFTTSVLEPEASKSPTPPDWLYLNNFEDKDAPIAVSLPAGEGRKFKNHMAKAITKLRADLPARFEKEAFQKKLERLMKKFNSKREELFSAMENTATKENFRLSMDEEGIITLTPLIDGNPVEDTEFEKLDKKLRDSIKAQGDKLLDNVGDYLRKINRNEQDMQKQEDDLRRETARGVLDECLGKTREKYEKHECLKPYFEDLEEEVVDNVDMFMPREASPLPGLLPDVGGSGDEYFNRYEVNLFVDNSKSKGGPVIMEDHPTSFNLLGSIEREAEMGALHTDFTLIKAGAIHKANHGFLILKVEDLLSHPYSWEGLLRALRAGESRIEDPFDPEQVRARTIQPAPIPLNMKVVLIGTEEHYETLLYADDRFPKYFKLKAHMQPATKRNAANIKKYLSVMGNMARELDVLPFDREALAELIDISSRVVEDQKRLSLYFPIIRERMIEASALAAMNGEPIVTAKTLRQAVEDRKYRANLYEDEFMEEYDREVIKVATGGKAVGQANGLSVTLFGDYEFGLPHRIAGTVGVGHGGILDLEREAQLGGPIHTKGMMILKSCLTRLFAQDKPIVLTGSLCFEQSYAGVEGDSASGAELAALLSALSGVPIDLSYAFTGAVSQSGTIMAVGGVNRKIEGFFEVCKRHGLTGSQGVLLPADNVVNLMLSTEVIDAVEAGQFHIHPVKTIEEAMRILTGMPTGNRSKNGKFPANTLYRLVDDRLAELAKLASGDKDRSPSKKSKEKAACPKAG